MPTVLVSLHNRLIRHITDMNQAAVALALISTFVAYEIKITPDGTMSLSSKLILTTIWGLTNLATLASGAMNLLDGIIERSVISIVASIAIIVVPSGITAILIWVWVTGAP